MPLSPSRVCVEDIESSLHNAEVCVQAMTEETEKIDDYSARVNCATERMVEVELASIPEEGDCTDDICNPIDSRELRKRNTSPWDKMNAALPIHYVCMATVHSIVIGTQYGVMMGTMAVSGRIYGSSRILLGAPWLLTVLSGFLSDSVPIMGYHRKYYACIGWCVVALSHGLTYLTFEEPRVPRYCRDTMFENIGNFVPEAGICNPNADEYAWYVVYMGALSTIGLATAESAADGLLVECAQSFDDGRQNGKCMIQALCLRLSGSVIGSTFVAVSFNARRHLGFFDWEVDLSTINLSLCALSLVVAFLWTKLSIHDRRTLTAEYCKCDSFKYEMVEERARLFNMARSHMQNARAALRKISRILYTKKFTYFSVFQIVVPVLTWTTSPAIDMMRLYWNHVQQLQEQTTDICVTIVFVIGIVLLKESVVWNRRRTVTALATTVGALGSVGITMASAYGLVRNQYFYQVHELFLRIPRGINYAIAMVLAAEFCPVGIEASVYAVVTASHNLAPVLAQAIANPMFAYLPVASSSPVGALSDTAFYLQDSPAFRDSVAASLLVSASLLLGSMCFLRLLPCNALDNQRGSVVGNQIRCACMTGVVVCLVLASLIATVLAVRPETACHPFVGGKGCHGE